MSQLHSGHLPEEIQQDIMTAALGREFVGVLLQRRPVDPLGHLLKLAKDNAFKCLDQYIQADLFTPEGIAAARRYQNEVQRYFEMVGWIISALEAGDDAQDRITSLNDPELTHGLMETYGESERKQPDA